MLSYVDQFSAADASAHLQFGQHPAELVVNRLGKTAADGHRVGAQLETFFMQYSRLRGQQARACSDFAGIPRGGRGT